MKGWIENLEDFYSNISLYVQPSCTEGFGLEVLESMAHARPVLCSRGAGAVDVVLPHWDFEACNSDALAEQIDGLKKESWCLGCVGLSARREVEKYTWPKIRERYKALWREMLGTRN